MYAAPSGPSLRHLHRHATAQTRVLALNETRLYYFLPYGAVRLWDDPALERRLRAAQGPEEMVEILVARGWTHLLITRISIDGFFHAPTVEALAKLAGRYPQAAVVQEPSERLVDLRRLRRALKTPAYG